MTLPISDSVREKTLRCTRSFQCLKEKRDVCKVSIYVEGDGLFLKKAKYASCPYKKWGERHTHYMCSCPTRIELYQKLGV